MAISETQSLILSQAAQHEAGLAVAPKGLPAGARTAVFRSMLKNKLVTEINAPRAYVGLAWRQDEAGSWVALRITDDGLRAIGIDPNEGDTVAHTARPVAPEAQAAPVDAPGAEAAQGAPHAMTEADIEQELDLQQAALDAADDLALLEQTLATPAPTARATLRDAAAVVLAAWEDEANREADIIGALDAPMAALRALLVGKPARTPRDAAAPRKPREGTKQETVLTMLRRPEGATVAQIAEATGWAHHTVRGFFAGLKKKGIAVTVLERVRQVGPNKEGAKGSYTVYGIAA